MTIHALDLVSWDGADPERPIAVVDVACSAGHVHPGARPRPRRAARQRGLPRGADPDGVAGRSRSTTRRAARRRPRRRRRGPRRPPAAPPAARHGARRVPGRHADRRRGRRPSLAASSSARRAACPDPAEHYRLRDADGTLVAIASATGGRLAPDKVFVAPARPRPPRRSPDAGMDVVEGIDALAPDARSASSSSSACSTGCTSATPTCSSTSSREAAAARRAADRHHLRPPPRRDPRSGTAPPLLLDPDERLERLDGGRRRGDRRPAFRRRPAPDAVRRLRRARSARGSTLRGFLMTPDAAFGYERRGTPAAPAPSSARATGSRSWSSRRSPSTARTSGARRSGPRSRRATSPAAARLLGRPVTISGAVGERVDGRSRARVRPAGRAAARRRLRGHWSVAPRSHCGSSGGDAHLVGAAPGRGRADRRS